MRMLNSAFGDSAMILRIECRTRRGQWARAGLLTFLLPLTACSFEVTNPGPVQDKFLDGPLAREGVVSGVQRALLDAHYDTDRNSASGVREIFPGGNVGRHGVNNSERQGIYDMTVTSGYWNVGQNGRWLAENAVGRFRESMTATEYASSSVAGRANLYAGFHNRHMGEMFCDAVIDGGPIVPYTEFFVRADTFFTRAIAILTAAKLPDLAMAAVAGRASVRADLGRWTDAVADAGTVPSTFRFVRENFNLDEAEWNTWVAATASEPFRTITTWNTFYENYFRTTGDPRTPWDKNPTQPFGSALVAPYGNVPFYRQLKYLTRGDPVNLATGREMRLIEAEALLLAGSWPEAMVKINALRATVKSIAITGITATTVVAGNALAPWTATNITEAGTAYKKEHGIELWLEGRRMGARRRWSVNKLPGDLTVWEIPSTTQPVHEKGAGTLLSPNMNLCMAVPQTERQLNPNIVYP
jgi:hypothetical protein